MKKEKLSCETIIVHLHSSFLIIQVGTNIHETIKATFPTAKVIVPSPSSLLIELYLNKEEIRASQQNHDKLAIAYLKVCHWKVE